jgi:hypothetical protein
VKTRGRSWHLAIVILLAVIGIGASLALDLDAVNRIITSDIGRTILKFAALALAASPGIVSFARAERRAAIAALSQAARDGVEELEAILSSAINALFDGEPAHHIRANVMIYAKDRLKMFASANMRAFLDYKMELAIGQGCAGEALRRAIEAPVMEYWRPVLARGPDMSRRALKARWKLTPDQIRKTADILWVMSMPLIANSAGKRAVVGVLNFDGVVADLKNPEVFHKQAFIGTSMRMADRIVEHLMTKCRLMLDNIDNRFRDI